MTTANKVSIKKGFDPIKDDFSDLLSKGKTSQKSMTLLKTRYLPFNIILVVFFKKTNRMNNNSNIISS